MTTDIYLKAPSEEAFETAMQGIFPSATFNMDVLGTLYQQGHMIETEEGEDYVQGAPLEGWHVNIRLEGEQMLPERLEPFRIPTPAFPRRIFW